MVSSTGCLRRAMDVWDAVGMHNTLVTPLGVLTGLVRIGVASVAVVVATVVRGVFWFCCAGVQWKLKAKRFQELSTRQMWIGLLEVLPLGLKRIARDELGWDVGSIPSPRCPEVPSLDFAAAGIGGGEPVTRPPAWGEGSGSTYLESWMDDVSFRTVTPPLGPVFPGPVGRCTGVYTWSSDD